MSDGGTDGEDRYGLLRGIVQPLVVQGTPNHQLADVMHCCVDT